MNEKIKNSIKEKNKESVENDYYMPKFFGESKSVEHEINGLTKVYSKVTEWSNGEGYDISFETQTNAKTKEWESKSISLHLDELDCLLAGLNHFKYFG